MCRLLVHLLGRSDLLGDPVLSLGVVQLNSVMFNLLRGSLAGDLGVSWVSSENESVLIDK